MSPSTASHHAELRHRSGRGVVVARRSQSGGTAITHARADSPLRFVRPTFAGANCASVCLVTFGGGLVDGDSIDVDLDVGPGATLLVFTQSSTKVFRGSSRQTVRGRVEGTLVFLPDPVAAFADARFTQTVDIDLVGAGTCVLLDGFTSGRPAFGDRWAMRSLDLRTTVRHDARPIVVDALHFDANDGPLAERAGRFDAFATLTVAGARATSLVDAIQRRGAEPPTEAIVVATSRPPRADALGVPAAIVRVTATSQPTALDAIRSRLGNLPDIDAVDPFASRY